jgi:hypothetical protein
MPEPAGSQAVTFGDFDFGLGEALVGAADMRTDLRADRRIFARSNGCPDADGPILAGVSPLLHGIDIAVPVPRSVVAARGIEDEPCRVTTLRSRIG